MIEWQRLIADVEDKMFGNVLKHAPSIKFHFRFPSPLGEGAEGG